MLYKEVNISTLKALNPDNIKRMIRNGTLLRKMKNLQQELRILVLLMATLEVVLKLQAIFPNRVV
jgi:hypothetical protein